MMSATKMYNPEKLVNLLGDALRLISRELTEPLDLTIDDPDPEEIDELLKQGWDELERYKEYVKSTEKKSSKE